MITPTGTEPTITNVGGDFMFRGCFVDSFQGEILAKYTKENLGKTTAAVFTILPLTTQRELQMHTKKL